MIWLVVRHKMKDYAAWLPHFEANIPDQVAAGLHVMEVDRGLDDPNDLFVVLQVDDVAKARAFMQDPKLKDVMAGAGVVDEPTVYFMETAKSYMKPG